MIQLAHIRHLALDLDGTLYLGRRLFPCTPDFLATLRHLGLSRTFFTNNSSRSTRQYLDKLRSLGIDTSPDEIYSSTHSTLDYLREKHPAVHRLYLLGTPALREEFAEHGYALTADAADDEPDAVIVAFDTSLTYDRLCRAAWWISRGKPFIATHPDRVCPTDEPTVLVDCGSICRLLSHATGREPDAVLGKPSPLMLAGILRRHPGLQPSQIAVVGDRLYTDMAMARAAGAVAILVLSGETTPAQLANSPDRPDLVVANVGELAQLLRQQREAL